MKKALLVLTVMLRVFWGDVMSVNYGKNGEMELDNGIVVGSLGTMIPRLIVRRDDGSICEVPLNKVKKSRYENVEASR
jgi:hypothetical protein